MILEHLGLGLQTLLLFDGVFSKKQSQDIQSILQRRLQHEPLQYIFGQVTFLDCALHVDRNVLIPRPETELLAQMVTDMAVGKDVFDLCCGSGCIAIALAKHGAKNVTASDISAAALQVARQNSLANGVKIRFFCSNMFQKLAGDQFHLIVSNPPYIPKKDLPCLQQEIKNYEPVLALDGGRDGLDFYRIVAREAHSYLHPGGMVCLELGDGQDRRVSNLFKGSYQVELRKDFNGVPRFLFATLL